MSDAVYTIEEVAKILKVSQMTVRRLINERELEAFKVGNQWRIRKEALYRFMNRKI
jgi:excisionase family DNA binding protein